MYKQIFTNDLQEFLNQKGIDKNLAILYSGFQDFHYQSSLPLIWKDINQKEIVDFLIAKAHYDKVEITGKGFISVKFKLTPVEQVAKETQTVVIDYCGVNVAKKMHIGHIRSMFIGDFIANIHKASGDNVVKFNHVGDMGNQFGYLLNYIKINNLEDTLNNDLLTSYYKAATLLKKEDKDFSDQSDTLAYKLQHSLDKDITQLWEKCKDISLTDAYDMFEKLNIELSFENTQGESFYLPFCKSIVDDLLDKKIASKNEDGSVIILFDNKENLLIQKSNGNFLYGLYDLAALKWRQENINPDKIVYVVDNRQSLHFEQVFEVAKKAGYVKEDVILNHVSFGSIVGKDKKPLKTKAGDSVYLEDIVEEGKQLLEASEYFQNMDESIKSEIIDKTVVSGLKFYDLKFNKNSDYHFDWSYVLNTSGGSAPYIFNAMVRIDSIFYKKGLDVNIPLDMDFEENWNNTEKEIIFQIQKSKEVKAETVFNYQSQNIAENMMKLCQLFHNYYEAEMVLGSPDEDKKIKLLNYVYHSLQENISILGMTAYSCKQKMLLKNKKIYSM